MRETTRGRVLLVDDNVQLVAALRRGLGIVGYDVAAAHDGLTALGLAATFRPRLVMIDIALPSINGWGLARRLRAIELLRCTKLIAVSGLAEPSHRERSRRVGSDDHLQKPLKLAELVHAIDATLA